MTIPPDGESEGGQEVPQSADSFHVSEHEHLAVAAMTSDFAYSVRFRANGELDLEWITGAFVDVSGLPESEVTPQAFLALVHPDDWPIVEEGMSRLMAGEEARATYRIVRPDGETRWLQTVARPEVDRKGRVRRFSGAGSDVTRARQAQMRIEEVEAALRESEASYRHLIETVPAVVYIAEPGALGAWQYVSPQIERMLGFPAEEWIADPSLWARQIHPDDRERVLEMEDRVAADVERGVDDRPLIKAEYRLLTRDGTALWVSDEAHYSPDASGRAGLLRGVIADISERKRAEEALGQSEARYRSLFHGIPIGLYRSSPDGEVLEANQSLADILGYPDVDSLRTIRAEDVYVDIEDRRRWRKQLESTGRVIGWEMAHRRGDGQICWVRDTARAVRDQDGRILYYEGMLEDITERKHAETALRESETRFRLIAENAKDIIYRFRLQPTPGYEYVSPSATAITGYAPEDFYGDPEFWQKAIHPDDFPLLEELFSSGRAFTETYANRWLTKDGRVIWCETRNSPIYDENENLVAFVGVTRDVSDQVAARKELEDGLARLRRSDEQRRDLMIRLVEAQEEERRRIAGEIHDDSVQVMAAVALRLEILERKLKGHEATRTVLPKLRMDVQTAVQRLRRLIFDLRPLVLDRDGLAAAIRLHLEGSRMESELDYRVEDRLLREPPDNIRMALYRIAQEALANARKHAQARRLTVELDDIGASVRLRIADDGRGFDADQNEGPLPGHLGLSAMREQAEILGGQLTIRSTPGEGTRVEARVPLPEGGDDV